MNDDSLTWREVLELHGSRRGIRVTDTHASLLLDFGLSRYVNRREGQRIHYEGEGKRGDQTPTGGNAGLLACMQTGRAIRIFERTRPGQWFDRGEYIVTAALYRDAPTEQRMIFEFTLEPNQNFNAASASRSTIAFMKPDDVTGQTEKLEDSTVSVAPKESVSAEVENAAEDVGKPASEPVERTAELLNAELEVTKAGIAAPREDDLPLPR